MGDELINGRYRLQEKLGEGGMAVVYCAHDQHLGRDVAIKIMKTSLTGTSKKRFAREFRAVTAVNHPSCIKVFEFGETADFPFFTMEIFRGAAITSLIGQSYPLIFSALLQAAEALDDVHQHKIIHRDIKPTNLLVDVPVIDGAEPQVQLRLTDFGLARFAGSPSSLSIDSGFVGTLAYSAPEQISNGLIDHRADLYALAIVGFEILTGQHPFEVARRLGIQALMRAQLTEHPSGLRALKSDIPIELEEVILAYLNKNPAQRPSSAAFLRHVLSGLLGQPSAHSFSLDTTDIRWPSQRLIARSHELGKIVESLNESLSPMHMSQAQWSQAPIPSVVFITGEAGFGKSNLLREVADAAQRQGTIVLEGRCFEGNLAPFQPFVEIIRQMLAGLDASDSDSGKGRPPSLASFVSTRSSHEPGAVEGTVIYSARSSTDALREVIQKYSPELLRIAPDLRQWLPGEAFRQGDLSRETNYVLRAIATFFVEVSQARGVCLLIEDLHWADQSTLDLMRHLASSLFRRREQCLDTNLTYPRLFCCCTIRSEKVHSEGLARELQRERYARIIELQPLSVDGSRALISLHLECDPAHVSPNLIQQLHIKCHGNPYFIAESVRAWRGAGRITRTDGVWQLDESIDESSAWPESVRDVLRTRLDSISSTARQVLAACSVIGAVVDPDVLREVLHDVSETDFLDAVDELLSRQVLVETGSAASRLEFTHDLLRELSYDELTENRRRAIHRRVGETLEELNRTGREIPPDAMAGHFAAAQVAEKAYHYLLESGEAALRLYAADDAIRHLERALKFGESVKSTAERQRLFELLALAHGAAGRPREAIACLERNREHVTEAIPLARLEERIGALYFRIGDFQTAVDHFDCGMTALKIHRPRNLAWVAVCGVWGLVQYFLTAWLPLPRKLTGEKRARVVVAHEISMNLTYLWPQHNIVRCLHATGRQFATARATGDPVYLLQGFARQALLLSIQSFQHFAKQAAKSAMKHAAGTNDVELQAIAKGHVGCVHYFAGRLDEAEKCLLEAVSVLERRGDSWFRLFFSHNLRHVYSTRADHRNEVAFARLEMQIGETVHDKEAACWGAYGMAEAMARVGRLEEARNYIQRALGMIEMSANIIVRPTALQIYGFVLLQSGEYQAARQVLDEARHMIESNIAFVDYSMRTYPLLVEAVLGNQWHVANAVSKGDADYAWRMSRLARFWGWRFPNYGPHAMRASGRAAFSRGKTAKAQHFFRLAIGAADKLGSPFDKARAMVDLAKVSPSEQVAFEQDARAILLEIGATLPPGEIVASDPHSEN